MVLLRAGNRTCNPWFTRLSTYPLHHGGWGKNFFVAFLGLNQFCWVGLRYVCWFHDGNTQRLTESGFMEKPGIESATPGLQGIALIPYTTAAEVETFCGFPGYKPVLPGWFKICVGFITGTPKGSPKVVLWRSRESNVPPLVNKA